METIKRLPLSFFEKNRPAAPSNNSSEIVPIKWPKEVLNGEKQIIVNLPKNKNRGR